MSPYRTIDNDLNILKKKHCNFTMRVITHVGLHWKKKRKYISLIMLMSYCIEERKKQQLVIGQKNITNFKNVFHLLTK